jgi:signal transduction histidine kinase
VPPSERERIFRPFERGSRKPKGGRIGYGLGLALVRTVADLHDGQVLVTEAPGGGARFRMEFPLETVALAGT